MPVDGILMGRRGYKCVANHALKEIYLVFTPPLMGENYVFENQELTIIAEKNLKDIDAKYKSKFYLCTYHIAGVLRLICESAENESVTDK